MRETRTCETGRHEDARETSEATDEWRTGDVPIPRSNVFMCLVSSDVDDDTENDEHDYGGNFQG